ncbi:MAG: hypothetical protein NZ954_08225 [Thermofilaceae archaeon]|nr:hypothetical protein [Thermofilaceae archaeon]
MAPFAVLAKRRGGTVEKRILIGNKAHVLVSEWPDPEDPLDRRISFILYKVAFDERHGREVKLQLTETRFHVAYEGKTLEVVADALDFLLLALLLNSRGGEEVLVKEIMNVTSPYEEIEDAIYSIAERSRKQLESLKLPVDPFTTLFNLPLVEHIDTPNDLLFFPRSLKCRMSILDTGNFDEEGVGDLLKRRQTKATFEELNVKSSPLKVDIHFLIEAAKPFRYGIRLEERGIGLVASELFSSAFDFSRSKTDVTRRKMPVLKAERICASIIKRLIDLYSVMTVYEKHTLGEAKTLKSRGYRHPRR